MFCGFFILFISFFVCIVLLFFFFFKHKTAYEMRISDWSSDVCSSDLDSRDDVRLLLDDPTGWQMASTPLIENPGRDLYSISHLWAVELTGDDIVDLALVAGAGCPHGTCFGVLPGNGDGPFPAPQVVDEVGRASWRERGWQYG